MNDNNFTSKSFVFSPFQENTYVLYNGKKEAIIIDPGMQNSQEEKKLDDFIFENKLTVKRVLLTHAHIDHIFGLNHCVSKYKTHVALHQDSIEVLQEVPRIAELYGFNFELEEYQFDVLEENDIIEFGLKVLYVPGHVPGHLVFLSEDKMEMWGGDVLFYGSIGRTDLPGGNHDLLIEGIKSKILTLNSDIIVHSGHGPDTKIGFERENNPFLQ